MILQLQGVPLMTNGTAGQDRLMLAGVTRGSSGGYTCAAANSEGARTSNTLTMAVKCEYQHACTSHSHSLSVTTSLYHSHLCTSTLPSSHYPTQPFWHRHIPSHSIGLPYIYKYINPSSYILSLLAHTRPSGRTRGNINGILYINHYTQGY